MNQKQGEEQSNITKEPNSNPSNLPLEEKIKSKDPQIRKEGYEAIISSGLIDKYDLAIDKCLSDSSHISLQPALELVMTLIKHKQANSDQARNWSKIIIEQTYGCNNVQCQDLSKEIMCELIATNYDSVMASIKEVMTHNAKAIKKIMQCEILFDYLLGEFGCGINFADIDEVIKGLTVASNPGVRNYAMTIMKNIYRWDGENKIANEVLKDKEKEAINDNREVSQPKRIINANTIQNEFSETEQAEKEAVPISSNHYEEEHSQSEGDKLHLYYTSKEFLDKFLTKHQKAIEKKKLLEELLSYLLNQHEPMESRLSFAQYALLFETLKALLNENNANVIISEIALLSYFSKLFLHNQQYFDYLLDIIPKLLDKFNLQSNAINKEVHRLLNEFIEYNLSFDNFVAYLENISIDDNINYTLNLLTFAFEQIKKDEKINIKSISNDLMDLLQKLSVEDNNEISNLAFNILEMLNMRNYLHNNKPQIEDVVKPKGKLDEDVQDDIVYKKAQETTGKKKEGKSFRKIVRKKDVAIKPELILTEGKEEAKTEALPLEAEEKQRETQPLQEEDSHRKVLSSKHLNYDDIVIGSGKKPNATNELLKSIKRQETEEIKGEEDNIELSTSKPMLNSYDERVVGGKSNFNQMFSDEIEKLSNNKPPAQSKERLIAPKKKTLTVEEMEEMYSNKKTSKPLIEIAPSKPDSTKNIQLSSNNTTEMPISTSITQNVELNPEEELSQPQSEAYTKESKKKALEDFQNKVDQALLNKEDNQNARKDSSDIAEKKKVVKDETQFEEIKAILGNDIVSGLDDAKWEMKKQGLELIAKLLQSNSIPNAKSEALYSYLKFKLKNFKETNFNVNREAITLFTTLFKSKHLSFDSKHYLQVLDAYHDKFSDGKLKDQINQLLIALIEIQSPGEILKALLFKLQKKPNVNLLKDYAAFFAKCVEDYEINQLPVKEMVDLCKTMAANSNPQVRAASTSLLCALYAYIGNDIKVLIKDIKESTLKVIETELQKVTVIGPVTKKKKETSSASSKLVKENLKAEQEEKASLNNNYSSELIPRVDISKKITPKLLKDINDGKWPEKKEACEALEKIIVDANMKILPNDLGDLFNLIKLKLSDGNKNIVRMVISLLCKLIEASGPGFKAYTKPIALALLPNFADKMQALREECHLCFEKWITFVGFDTFVFFIPPFIKTDNFDVRTELLKLLMKHKELFNKQMGEAVFRDMVSPLLLCLQDRAVSVRTAAEEMIVFSLQYITLSSYYKEVKSFKPAIANDLKSLLEKIKCEEDCKGPQDIVNSVGNVKSTISNEDHEASMNKSNDRKGEGGRSNTLENNEERPCSALNQEKKLNCIRIAKKKKNQLSNDDVSNMIKKNLSNNTPTNAEKVEASSTPTIAQSSLMKSPNINLNKVTSVFPSTKKASQPKIQVFLSAVTIKPNKEKRLEVDKKFKFSLETLSNEYEFKLKDQVKGLFTEEFNKTIFSEDFKQIVEAVNYLKSSIEKEESISLILDNLDLILKIIGFKTNTNQNPSILKALFDFLEVLHNKLSSSNYTLNETESNIILFLLVDKLGVSNSTLKEMLQSLIDSYFTLFTPSKAMAIALNYALGKNIKVKSEMLDICSDLYFKGTLDIVNKQFSKLFSKLLSTNDNSVKFKTIALFKEIYLKIGDELWSIIDLKEKERELLEANLYKEEEDEEYEDTSNDITANNNGSKGADDSSSYKANVSNGSNQQASNLPSLNCTASNYQPPSNKEPSPRSNALNRGKKGSFITPHVFGTDANLKDMNDLLKTIKNLVSSDLPERVNTIIIIHEFICAKYEENKELLKANIDSIIKTFIEAMHSLFSIKNISEIPIKFTKYLATVLCKIASNKELISGITHEVLFNLTEEILFILLVENLDKIGDNQEGSIIFKSLNSTMLRILENCNPTHVIITLLELIKNYRVKESKLAGLAIKCLLKVNQNIQQIINSFEIDKVLLQFHLLLCEFEKTQSDLQIKTQTDQMILRYIKNFLNEIVKIKKEDILNDYILGVKPHQTPDKYILKWIKNVLSSLNIYPQYPSPVASSESSGSLPGVIKPNYETVHTTENVMSITVEPNPSAKKDVTPEKKSSAGRKDILDDLKSKMMKQQSQIKSNRNANANLNSLNSHNFNNTISELKKKWNDVNKRSKGGN